MELSDQTMLRVKTVGDPHPACKSELCDKEWQHDLFSLAESITNNNNILPVSLLESESKLISVNATGRTVELRGIAITSANTPCRQLDSTTRISEPVIPSLNMFKDFSDGEWKICVAAVVLPQRRNLYNSPAIIIDKTAPERHGSVFVSANGTLTPTVAWSAASDAVTTSENLKYRVTVTRAGGGGASLSGRDLLIFTQTNNDPLNITGLEGGNTYSVVVTAIDEAGNETNYDPVTVQAGPPTVPILTISEASKSFAQDEESITWTVTFAHADNVALTAGNVSFTRSNIADTHVLETSVTCMATTSCDVTAKVKSGDGGIAGITLASGVSNNVLGSSLETSKVTSVTVDTTVPVSPVIADASKSFNTVFSTTIGQGIPADGNFKEIRFNLSSTAPTCSTGTVYSSAISIPATTTEIRAVTCDLAGNASSIASATYTFDTGAPGSPAVVSSSAYSAVNSFKWTWSPGIGDGVGTYRYRLDNSDLSTGTTETTATSFTGTGLSDGLHTLYVQERDSAGNWSAAGSSSVTIDTVVPMEPSASEQTKTFNTSFTVTLTPNEEPDSNYKEIRYSSSGTVPTCSSGSLYSEPITILTATTVLSAIACDLAGNASAVTSATYTYDNTPPSAPTVTSAQAYWSSSSVMWSWSAGGGDGAGTFRYKLDDSNLTTGATQTTSISHNGSGLTEGSHTLYVEERDAIGNWSSAGSYSVTVDVTAPVTPVIADAGRYFNSSFSTTISQGVPADLNFKDIRYTVNGTNPTCSTGTVYGESVNINNATITLKAVACDRAGNASPVAQETYIYDNTPPTSPTVTSAATHSASASVTWTWSSGGGGNGTYRYRLDNADLSTGSTVTTSTTYTGVELADGAHVLHVQERDASGNWSTSSSYSVTVDTTAPFAPVIADLNKEFNSSFTTTVAQSASPDVNFKEFRYNLLGTVPTCSTGTTYSSNIFIPAQTTTLTVVACDLAGNVSFASQALYTFDNTPPDAPTVISSSSTSNSSSVTWTWSSGGGGGNGVFRYRLDNADLSVSSPTADTSFTGTLLSDGTHILYVQERDSAGNWSANGSYSVTVSSPPPNPPTVSGVTEGGGTSASWTWSSGGGGTGAYRISFVSPNESWGPTNIQGNSYGASLNVEGSYTLYVQEQGPNGSWSSSGSSTVLKFGPRPSKGPASFEVGFRSGTTAVLNFYSPTATYMYISSTSCESGGTLWMYSQSATLTLIPVADGSATAYVKFIYPGGQESECLTHRVGVTTPIAPEGTSCQQIFNSGQSRGSGVYLIDPDGAGGLPAENQFCNMSYSGGGWTLVIRTFASNESISNRIPTADEYRSTTSVGSITGEKYILGNDRQGFPSWGAIVNGVYLNSVSDFGGNPQKLISHVGGSTSRGCNWQSGSGAFVMATTDDGACIKFGTGTIAEGGMWHAASVGNYWATLIVQGSNYWSSGNFPPFQLNILNGADNNYCSIMQYGTITFGHGYTCRSAFFQAAQVTQQDYIEIYAK